MRKEGANEMIPTNPEDNSITNHYNHGELKSCSFEFQSYSISIIFEVQS